MIPRYALTYGGDIDACIKYIPFAQNLLAHAAQSGQQVLRRQLNDADWIRVDVNKWGVSAVHIEAGSADIYLESGFYDLLSSATCTENTYKPAILHYNTPIGAYINSLDKPTQGKLTNKLEGEKLLDGYTSLSVGGKKLQTTVTDFCGNTYASSVPAYSATPEKTLMQKQVQNRIPSSMFSGKMRLYVQALYGSPRTDYRINIGLNGLPNPGDYKLYVEDTQQKDFELVWEYPYTAGIYTTDDYKYYVMNVVTTQIHFYPLVLSSAAEIIRRALITSPQISDPAFVSRIEAYLLATGKVDTKNAFTINISGAVSIGGGPLGYGWKFSQSGKKCTVVVHADISPLGNMKKFQASELTVTINEADGVFTASMVVTKTGTWSHNSYFVAWTPDFYQYSQMQYGNFDTDVAMSTFDCPIYGWYEKEEYKPLLLSGNIVNRADTQNDSFSRQVTPGCGTQDLSVAIQATYNGANGSLSCSGLYQATIPFLKTTTYQTKTWYWSAPGNWTGPATSSAFSEAGVACDLGGVFEYLVSIGKWTKTTYFNIIWTIGGDGYSYGWSTRFNSNTLRNDLYTSSNNNITGKFSVVIPLLDAESLTVIKGTTTGIGSRRTYTGAIDGNCTNDFWEIQIVKVKIEHSSGNITVLEVVGTYEASHRPNFSNSHSGNVGPLETNVSERTAKMDIVMPLNKPYAILEDDYAVKETSGAPANSTWSDSYLYGTFGQPLGGKTIITKSSYNGANITYHGEVGDGEIVNGFRNKSAVGWA